MSSEVADLLTVIVILWLAGVGMAVVIYGTVTKRRWGINLNGATCPKCGSPAPVFRHPASRRQALWGGWTCAACGIECDKWGREIAPVGPTPRPAFKTEAEVRAHFRKRFWLNAVILYPLFFLVQWLIPGGHGFPTNWVDAALQAIGNLFNLAILLGLYYAVSSHLLTKRLRHWKPPNAGGSG